GVSPFSPRIFGTFLDLYIQHRTIFSKPEAAMRAAHLSFWTKLPDDLEKKAVQLMADTFGSSPEDRKAEAPRSAEKGIWFGKLFLKYGPKPVAADPGRFPLTDERCKNLELFAASHAFGQGRLITCT